MTQKQKERLQRRDQVLDDWAQEHDFDLEKLDEGQRWAIFIGLQGAHAVGAIKPLRRVLSFFLSHSGMGLTETIVGAIVGVSERSAGTNKKLDPRQLLDAVSQSGRGHRQPKLRTEHAGPVARMLVRNPKATADELLESIRTELGVTVERHTLSQFLERHGLGCLKSPEVEAPPFFMDTPLMAAPSC
jgi:hypothetical protein